MSEITLTPAMMNILVAFAGAVGAIIGSFLNVVIWRLPRQQSVAWPPSACPSCGHHITWYENIPVVSYLGLRGKCGSCRAPIAVRYPIVEALTAAMFAAGMWYYGPTPLLAQRLVFGCLLLVLFAIDLEHYLLPNALTLPGIVIGFIFSFFVEPGWMDALIGILVGGLLPYVIAEAWQRLRNVEALGMGDVKMLAMVGAFLGWKLTLATLMFASISGSVIGIGMMAFRGVGGQYALPFGTFLALGAAIAGTVGPPLIDWYSSASARVVEMMFGRP